jgi:hypothetical protein
MTTNVKAALFGLALVALAPLDASACPLCIAAQDKGVQIAYMVASAFMTVLPLALIGGLIFWLRRRAQQLAFEEQAGVLRLPTSGARTKKAA